MLYIIIAMFTILLILSIRYFLLKNEIRSITKQLQNNERQLVHIQLLDKDLNTAVLEINELLHEIEQTIIRENNAAALLRESIVNTTHDMKTPLTASIGYLQLALKEPLDSQIEEMLKISLHRAVYCNSLINDFFELSMLETKGCKPQIERYDVTNEICEQILANVPLFEEYHITPHFDCARKEIFAQVDIMMFRRVIQNLISNGIKYAKQDIYFYVTQDKETVITVSNHTQEIIDVTHIFDKFYMQDHTRNNGSGIGLYLCRKFVENMGGTICATLEDGNLNIEIHL